MKKHIFILLSVVLWACEKKELPVPAHDAGNVIRTSVNLESNYRWQIFYDLETNRIVSQNMKTDWDIAFESSEDGYHVILNSSKSMFSSKTNSTDILSVTDTVGFSTHKKWDASSGNLDSTAIGDWRAHNNVYLIDRGYNSSGVAIGVVKLKLLQVSKDAYTFWYASLNNSYSGTFTLHKNNAYNFNFFSFDIQNEVKSVEPLKDSWDLCFTQYTHTFYNPIQPYLVTGCLSNSYSTSAALDTLHSFESINLNTIQDYPFFTNKDIIGYDWKVYTGSLYVTQPQKIYIIKNRNGKYYKLHFIDFYNSDGSKGNPTWEFQKL